MWGNNSQTGVPDITAKTLPHMFCSFEGDRVVGYKYRILGKLS
jgi:hypothetical protein